MPERLAIFCAEPHWAGPPLTARALAQQGAELCIVAPPDSYVARTKYKIADILMPFAELNRKLPAILRTLAEQFGAQAVLAGDDVAFAALARLVERADGLSLNEPTRALLMRSMPDAQTAALIAKDSAFIQAQAHLPCPPPPCLLAPSAADAQRFAADHGFPVVVKRDGSASGLGVAICRNSEELATAIATAREARGFQGPGFVVQKFIEGVVYGVTLSGVSGQAAGGFSFVKHRVHPPLGATSVAKLDMRHDIIANSRQVFESSGLNGFSGFDYILDESGRAWFIEINPRIMPTGHVGRAFGLDLVAAYLAKLRGQEPPAPAPPTHDYVALFPNEMNRDPASEYLRTAYHDVPRDDPAVYAAMLAGRAV